MNPLAQEQYLANEVMTAAPQKLQLMLIEAAIRFGRRAGKLWQEGNDEEASEAIVRSQHIVADVMAAMAPNRTNELVQKALAVYGFVFRALMQAHLQRDEAQLAAALGVLEEEQKTWQELCRRLGTKRSEPAIHDDGQTPVGFSLQA